MGDVFRVVALHPASGPEAGRSGCNVVVSWSSAGLNGAVDHFSTVLEVYLSQFHDFLWFFFTQL